MFEVRQHRGRPAGRGCESYRARAFLALACLATGLLPGIGHAAGGTEAAPGIEGSWLSDAAATLRYNEEHARLEEKTREFERDTLGHLRVTLAAGHIHYVMPDRDVTIADRPFHVFGYDETLPYRILGATADAIAIETEEPITHRPTIVTYHFVGPDALWVYLGDAMPTLEPHEREYFIRAPEVQR